MNQVKVSIVAAVYNVAPYLSNFIDSVVNQTYHDWELLLVEDGSTDESGRLCDDYLRIDSRIRVIHQPNEGVSSARNAGIKEANGDWLLLPDADDLVSHDALETLLSYAKEDVDLVCAAYTRYVQGELVPERVISETKKVSVSEYVDEIGRLTGARNIDRYCWNKLFRLSLIKSHNILFHEEFSNCEDILYVYQYLSKCTHEIQCVPYKMYTYFRRSTGAAMSLLKTYTPKSGGKFLVTTMCYDLLKQMEASQVTKERMRREILDSYNIIVSLIDKSGCGYEDKKVFKKKLLQYYSGRELLMMDLKKLYHRVCSVFRK